jgi:ribulose-phosphate 3-epimerase
MVVIEPSILSADYARFGEQARELEAAGAAILQVDIMDGRFVPNLTFGPGLVSALRRQVKMKLDVHLMILEPEHYFKPFIDAGADRLIVHQETCPHLYRTLESIRQMGVQAGVTLNPGTPAGTLSEVLDLADVVQVMTVNPGFGGQVFLSSQLEKIRQIRRMLDQHGLSTPIAVDGGIDLETAPLVVAAGASVLISGTTVFDPRATIAENLAALRASYAAME